MGSLKKVRVKGYLKDLGHGGLTIRTGFGVYNVLDLCRHFLGIVAPVIPAPYIRGIGV